jgi:DNA-binding response OmpR family regulator
LRLLHRRRAVRILVVEDDRIMAGYIQQGLVDQGYTVDVAHDGEKGQELAESTGYDLIILDILLPGKSGIDLCRDLRKKRVDSRILMLTCRDTLDDKIQGLDSGADDYLTKPFEFPELFARLRALLRRIPAGDSTILRVGDVTLNTLTREVRRREDAV